MSEYPREVTDHAYRHLFEGMAGSVVLEDLKNVCHYERITFNTDPLITAFNEGQRSVILLILDKMRSPVTEDDVTTTTDVEGESYDA